MQEPLNSEPPKTRGDRKALKYKEELASFDLKEKSQIRTGLVMDRKTTDCGCLMLFLAVILTMVGMTGYGLAKGNVRKLIGPVNGDHQICGADSLKDYPQLYITDLQFGNGEIAQIFQSGVCVKTCPMVGDTIDCSTTSQVQDCNSASVTNMEYNTVAVAGYCFPKNIDELPAQYIDGWNKVINQFKESQAGRTFNDLQVTKTAVFVCLGMAFVYSILYIYAMSRFANCLAKFAIILIELFFVGAMGSCFYMRGQDHTSNDQKKGYMIGGIIAAVVFVLFNLMLCCFRKQVQVAIAVVDATADFFAATKRIVIVSVVYFFVTLIVIVVWMVAFGCVLSLNEITADPTSPQGKDIVWKSQVTGLLCFMCFGLIWLVFWIQDKTGFICMVSASTYYFSSSKDKEGSASVLTGAKFAYFKHAGSLAFGSLIMTIVTIVRMIVEHAADNVERGGDNAAVKVIACCARCCIRIFENLVEYINRVAYAYMAVSGDSFCTSAWNGFMLNLRHGAKFYFGIFFANMFIQMGKIMITCLNCATFYMIMKYGTKSLNNVSSIWGPIVVIAIATFITAQIFLGLFDEATTATLHCLCIDLDLNDKQPKFGPPSFHEKLSKIYGEEHSQKAQQYQQVHQTHNDVNKSLDGTGHVNANANNMV